MVTTTIWPSTPGPLGRPRATIKRALQRELDGLAWILEPSRVVDGGSDLDLHGWADGTLLTFELRDGRIRDWHARSCPEPDALPLVSSTPPHWRSFATENAALAAILGANRA